MAHIEKTMFREYDIRGRVTDEELHDEFIGSGVQGVEDLVNLAEVPRGDVRHGLVVESDLNRRGGRPTENEKAEGRGPVGNFLPVLRFPLSRDSGSASQRTGQNQQE